MLQSKQKITITMRLEKSIIDQLNEIKKKTNINKTEIIRQALKPVLKQYQKQEA